MAARSRSWRALRWSDSRSTSAASTASPPPRSPNSILPSTPPVAAALRTLADCERTYRGGDWGADGIIVFAPSSNSALFAVPASGGQVKPATPFDDKIPDLSHRFPHFLPGGRRFLYLAWSNAADVPEEAVGLFVG